MSLFPLILDVVQPPLKISRPSTPPVPAVSRGYNSATPVSLKEYQSSCLQETNKLRARLGLKPLRFEDIPEFRVGGECYTPASGPFKDFMVLY
jgi:hypothetical protein